jgi:transglutaminase-like putative cysteine protease
MAPIPLTIVPCDPDTDRSTAATVALMYQVIAESYRRPEVIRATREACGRCGLLDPAWRKARAIWEWIHRHIRFMSDEQILSQYFGLPEDLELLQRPELLLRTRKGDCDCFTMLTCSMLLAAGVAARIVTIAADPSQPRRWSHVYAVQYDQGSGSETPMDTSHGRYYGWQAPRYYRRHEWRPQWA